MRRRAALVFVFITVLLDMLAIGLIAPVLAPLVVSFLGGDTARAAEIYGLAALSLLNAAYGLFVPPESLPPERRAPLSWRRAIPLARWPSSKGARRCAGWRP